VKFKLALFLTFILFFNSDASSQVKQVTYCELVLEFINSEKVLTHLKLDKYNSSVIYILDPGHILDSCALSYWNGIPVTIINKGPLIDSTQQIELYFVVRARCNFFEISKWQSNGKEKIFFRHGCSGEDAEAEVIKRNHRVKLGRIDTFVE